MFESGDEELIKVDQAESDNPAAAVVTARAGPKTEVEVVRYTPMPQPYNRQNVVQFRKDFLEQRQREVRGVIAALRAVQRGTVVLGKGNPRGNLSGEAAGTDTSAEARVVAALLPEVDLYGDLFMAGHSFGAATSVMVVNAAAQHAREKEMETKSAIKLATKASCSSNKVNDRSKWSFLSFFSPGSWRQEAVCGTNDSIDSNNDQKNTHARASSESSANEETDTVRFKGCLIYDPWSFPGR